MLLIIKYSCQRFSNKSRPEITDEEVMTIYLYAMHIVQRFKVKQIHEYASDLLYSWLPLLPYKKKTVNVFSLWRIFKTYKVYLHII